MNRVAIVGAGITDCRGRWVEATYWNLFQQATQRTLEDAKCTAREVDSVVYGIYNDIFEHQAIPESALTGVIGMACKPGTRVTSGGATGFYAMRTAIMEVASGVSDLVLCVGGEKATDCFDPQSRTATPMVIDTIAKSWDPFFEYPLGATASDSYAQMCMGYDDRYPGDIGDVTVRAKIIEMLCRQGNKNPFGQRRDETVTVEQVMASRWIIAPFLRLLEACMYTEGAAGVLFASEKKAREISERTGVPPIWVKGIGAANESYQVGRGGAYKPLWSIVSDRLAAERAYAMAGVKPSDIQLVELHDAFIAQFMITMGEMGFVPLGQTRRLVDDGVMADIRELGDAKRPSKGQVLINPSGGLIFGGHFVGGSNMFSMWSARREMLRRQMPLALVHGTGAINAVFGGAIVVELEDGGVR
ncbi:MAG TPA: thiolase family protein [Anaeromyxobacteraceae bacterium]|nr:thiolase family protein [Anaeromyxobacteraceae bacterium]